MQGLNHTARDERNTERALQRACTPSHDLHSIRERQMSDEKKAYDHTGEVTGFDSVGGGSTHETEHRDATTSAEERNEIDLDARNQEKQYGRRTHQDTRITSKEGTDEEQEDPMRQ
jgi:hypothetical protein